MRLAIGLVISPGFHPDNNFWLGRPDKDRPCAHCQRDANPHAENALGHPFMPRPEGFFAMWQRLQTGEANRHMAQPITGLNLIYSRLFPTDVARNEVCTNLLATDADWLLFLDTDMVHPADLPERLLSAHRKVITGRYHLKAPPFSTVAYVKHPTQDGPGRYSTIHFGQGIFEIERGGGGALLIHREVLEAIRDRQLRDWQDVLASASLAAVPDWLRHGYLPRRPTTQWFRYQFDCPDTNKRIDMNVSEDFWFYQQAREAGFSCWIDWDAECQHIGPMAVDSSFNLPFLRTSLSEYENPDQRDRILQNTVVRGYPGGLLLGDEDGARIPEYQITPGER
jgi:hypothetical protein